MAARSKQGTAMAHMLTLTKAQYNSYMAVKKYREAVQKIAQDSADATGKPVEVYAPKNKGYVGQKMLGVKYPSVGRY